MWIVSWRKTPSICIIVNYLSSSSILTALSFSFSMLAVLDNPWEVVRSMFAATIREPASITLRLSWNQPPLCLRYGRIENASAVVLISRNGTRGHPLALALDQNERVPLSATDAIEVRARVLLVAVWDIARTSFAFAWNVSPGRVRYTGLHIPCCVILHHLKTTDYCVLHLPATYISLCTQINV